MIEVWHAGDSSTVYKIMRSGKLQIDAFPDIRDYSLVAKVNTNILYDAFLLTQHADDTWWHNEEIRMQTTIEERSTYLGDLLIRDGVEYLITLDGNFMKKENFYPHAFIASRVRRD